MGLDGLNGELVWTGSFDLTAWNDIPSKDDFKQSSDIRMDKDLTSQPGTSSPDSQTDFKDIRKPLNISPKMRIKGKMPQIYVEGYPRIIKAVMLNNKRHVLTENSSKTKILVDIIACSIIKKYDSTILFEDILTQLNSKVWVASWCSLEIKTGVSFFI